MSAHDHYLKLAERYRREYQESGGGKPYHVHSGSAITLTPEAQYWAREFGLTNREYGKYLLDKHHLGDEYTAEAEVPAEEEYTAHVEPAEEPLPDATPSENVDENVELPFMASGGAVHKPRLRYGLSGIGLPGLPGVKLPGLGRSKLPNVGLPGPPDVGLPDAPEGSE